MTSQHGSMSQVSHSLIDARRFRLIKPGVKTFGLLKVNLVDVVSSQLKRKKKALPFEIAFSLTATINQNNTGQLDIKARSHYRDVGGMRVNFTQE